MQKKQRLFSAARHILLFVFLFVFPHSGSAQSKVVLRYIEKYSALADSLSAEYEIPVSVILGIAIVESSSGTGRNARLLNNHFGVVGKNNLLKKKGIKTKYKQYTDARSSYIDFCKLVSRRKYYQRLKGNSDYKLWVDAISKSGYSTVPLIWKREILYSIRTSKLEERGVADKQ